MERIGMLYKIEDLIRNKTPEEKYIKEPFLGIHCIHRSDIPTSSSGQNLFVRVRQWIGMLYKIEDLIRNKTPEEKYIERQKQSKPLLDAFFEWPHSLEGSVDRSSKIGDAILYKKIHLAVYAKWIYPWGIWYNSFPVWILTRAIMEEAPL